MSTKSTAQTARLQSRLRTSFPLRALAAGMALTFLVTVSGCAGSPLGIMANRLTGYGGDFSDMQNLHKAAEQGDAEAQRKLAFYYSQSDPRRSLELYHQAAEQGDAPAQYILGVHYDSRLTGGGPKDDRKAAEWYQKSIDGGHTIARGTLAHMYLEGRGVPRDREQACALFKRAAEDAPRFPASMPSERAISQRIVDEYFRYCSP